MDKIIETNWSEAPKRTKNMLEYQNWFDSCESIEKSISSGFIDFSHKIFTEDLYKIVGDPREKTCLEIGFGGGRLLNASSRFFKECIGVDILNPESISKTKKYLESNNVNNVKLFHREDCSSIEDESIDFAYSFIVFQHFSSFEEVKKYFSLFNRVLKKGGCAKIFLKEAPAGDKIPIPGGSVSQPIGGWPPVFELTGAQILTHKEDAKKSNNSKVLNEAFVKHGDFTCSSLFVDRNHLCDYLEYAGFNVIETGNVQKQMWSPILSGQYWIKFTKE